MQFNLKKGYCCDDLKGIVAHDIDFQNVPIKYIPKFRHFIVMLCPEFEHTNKDHLFARLINFCPWCGAQFPPSLGDAYYKTIHTEFAHSNCGHSCEHPREFESDEWWKKRGL